MEKQLSIQDAFDKEGETVTLKGWVYRERGSNNLRFIVLRDSSNRIQCVFKRDELGDEAFDEISTVGMESSIEVTGIVQEDERAPTGYELQVEDFAVVHSAEPFPIQEDQSKELLADLRHLWLRSTKMTNILKVRSAVFKAIREYFDKHGFYEFHSPIFQPTQSEGGSEVFEVKYFKDKMFLAQTWQLHAEAGVFGLEKIYTIAPSFRAEKSKTSRHLTEYWHAEMEEAWCDFEDIQDHSEGLLKHVVNHVLEHEADALGELREDVTELNEALKQDFPRITYTEALEILKEDGMHVDWGEDLGTKEERRLMEHYETPIIVTDYPKACKAFYMKETPENPEAVQGCDVMAPGVGEIIGGSQREEDIEEIKRRLREEDEDPDEYEFYLDTRKYGSVPHGGFGLGVERVIMWICGLETVKDAIPFPRTMTRYRP